MTPGETPLIVNPTGSLAFATAIALTGGALGYLAMTLARRATSTRTTLSFQDRVIGAATAIVLCGLLALRVGPRPELAADVYLAVIAAPLATIDLREQRLPSTIVAPSYPILGALLVIAASATAHWDAAIRAFLAMTALLAAFLAVALISHGGLGAGDIRLSGLLGLVLGWISWHTVVIGIFAGVLCGAVAATARIMLGHANMRTTVPFGPGLLVGTLAALIVT